MVTGNSIGYGLILGVALWGAAIGAIAALGAWAFLLFGSTARKLGRKGISGEKSAPGAQISVPHPAEEGGQLDEWETNRLDRAA